MTRRKKQTRFDSQRVIFFASLSVCFLSLFAIVWILLHPQTTIEQHVIVRVRTVKTDRNVNATENEATKDCGVEETPEMEVLDNQLVENNKDANEAEAIAQTQQLVIAPIEPALLAEPRHVVKEITPTSFQTNVEIRPKKISEAAIGDRTPGVNPEGNDGNDESVFLTQKHCVYSLVLKKENGSLCYVKLLRPDDWLDSEDVRICRNATGQILDDVDFITDELIGLKLVGDYAYAVWLELPEMGCVGWAKVVDVEDFQYAPGIGNLVTGTFKHISDDVIDLVVEGQTKPIGVTNSHPFWSVDREEFVPAGELLQGERLLLFSGDTVRVLQKLPRPGPLDVYNIEVLGEHVYQVTPDGALVHNYCVDRLKTRRSTDKLIASAYVPKDGEINLLIEGGYDIGHRPGFENRRLIAIWNKWMKQHPELDFSEKRWRNFYNMPFFYQIEEHMHNISHIGEKAGKNLHGMKQKILNKLDCSSIEELLERLDVPPKKWGEVFGIDVVKPIPGT